MPFSPCRTFHSLSHYSIYKNTVGKQWCIDELFKFHSKSPSSCLLPLNALEVSPGRRIVEGMAWNVNQLLLATKSHTITFIKYQRQCVWPCICHRKSPPTAWFKTSQIYHHILEATSLKPRCHQGLPWWPSGKGSACQCRRHGLDPWSGKIPHAMGQLSLCATTTESECPRTHAHSVRSRCNEKPAHCN